MLPIAITPKTEARCFICGENNRNRIPKRAIDDVWHKKKIRIPYNNRCCSRHLINNLFTEEALEQIHAEHEQSYATPEEFAQWFKNLDLPQQPKFKLKLQFSTLDPEDYGLLTGFSKEQFDNILSFIEIDLRNTDTRTIRDALGLFLVKLRTNMTHRLLQFLFDIKTPSVVSYILLWLSLSNSNYLF